MPFSRARRDETSWDQGRAAPQPGALTGWATPTASGSARRRPSCGSMSTRSQP